MTEHIGSVRQFSQLLNSCTIVIVDFYADWCAPCKTIAPIYEQLSRKFSKAKVVTFTKVNVDQQQQIAREHGVTSMPTFMIFRNSTVIDTIRGANPRVLTQAIENAVSDAGPPTSQYGSVGRRLGEDSGTMLARDFSSMGLSGIENLPSRLISTNTTSSPTYSSPSSRTANPPPTTPLNSKNTTLSSTSSSSASRDRDPVGSLFADRAARFSNSEASVRQAELAAKKAAEAAEQLRLKERRERLESLAKAKLESGDSKKAYEEKVRAKAVMEAERKKKEDAKERERVKKLIEDDKERRRLEKERKLARRMG